MKALIQRFRNDESGATAIEYALIAAFIGAVIAASVGTLGGTLKGAFDINFSPE